MFICPPKTSAEMSDRQSKFNSGPFWVVGIPSSNLSQSSHFSKWQFCQLLNPELYWSYPWALFLLHPTSIISISKSSWLYFQNMSRTWWSFLIFALLPLCFKSSSSLTLVSLLVSFFVPLIFSREYAVQQPDWTYQIRSYSKPQFPWFPFYSE